ncbi:unnamed protein product, partial [Onchocerca ochengi]
MRCACRACRFDKCVAVGMNPKAIQCNRTGRLSFAQETPTSSTSFYPYFESDIPQQQLSTSNSMEKELCCLLPQTTDSNRKRSSTSPDSESASKRAYTISALLDFPESETISTTDENSRFRCTKTDVPSTTTTNVISSIHDAVGKYYSISEKHERLILHLIRAQEIINAWLDPEKCDTSVSILDLLTRPSIVTAKYPIKYFNEK